MLTDLNGNTNAKAKKQAAKQKHNKNLNIYIHTVIRMMCGMRYVASSALVDLQSLNFAKHEKWWARERTQAASMGDGWRNLFN